MINTKLRRGTAGIKPIEDFEKRTEKKIFLHGIAQGLTDIKEGREISLTEVKKHLKLHK